MAVDPVIQTLMDLIEPPDDGDQARPTSDFGSGRRTGSSPHGCFDMNRGRGVQPHGRVTSPVYGKIKEIKPKLGRIVIEEWDPVTHKRTGYDVEILHTQTRTVKEGDPVEPAQQIGTQGDIGAERGEFHAHIQVYRSGDRTPLNPMRHLFEYHHPGRADTASASIRTAAGAPARATWRGSAIGQSRTARAKRCAEIKRCACRRDVDAVPSRHAHWRCRRSHAQREGKPPHTLPACGMGS